MGEVVGGPIDTWDFSKKGGRLSGTLGRCRGYKCILRVLLSRIIQGLV